MVTKRHQASFKNKNKIKSTYKYKSYLNLI